jgi:hypothetical protein
VFMLPRTDCRRFLRGLLPRVHENRATEARREFDSIRGVLTRRHIILMMESISAANQFVVIAGHIPFVRNVLAKIAQMIEARSLQVDLFRFDYGEGSFGQNIRGDVLHRGVDDLVNKADVPVLARRYAGDDLTPGDFGVDDGLVAASSVVDHHNEILHRAPAVTDKR